MSKLTQCDGPNCDVVLDRTPGKADVARQQVPRSAWLSVSASDRMYDFHSRACLAAWSSLLCSPGIPSQDGQPCTCHRAQVDPHTKAEHQAYPTVVDGL